MFDFISNPLVVAFIFFMTGFFVSSMVSGVVRIKQSNDRAAESTRRRQEADHKVTKLEKELDQVTRVLERQRLICNNCPDCNPGGAS